MPESEATKRTRNYPLCGATIDFSHLGGIAERCILAAGHGRKHQSEWGRIWDREPEPNLCDATSRPIPPGGPDWQCVLNAGHQGHHSTKDGGDWHRAPASITPSREESP